MEWFAPFRFDSPVTWMRLGVALVWVVFGLVFKALDLMPRHRRIVARVVGERYAGALLYAVALGEVGIGAWMVVGRALVACVALQTAMIVAMNALELRYARDLLLSPVGMVAANVVLLATAWAVALGGG